MAILITDKLTKAMPDLTDLDAIRCAACWEWRSRAHLDENDICLVCRFPDSACWCGGIKHGSGSCVNRKYHGE